MTVIHTYSIINTVKLLNHLLLIQKKCKLFLLLNLLNFVFQTHESISLKINQMNFAFLQMSEKLWISLSFNKNS
jgi:hypothetical protein